MPVAAQQGCHGAHPAHPTQAQARPLVPFASAVIAAVIDYVVSTVTFVDDDLELPLPGPDFSARFRTLIETVAPHPAPATPPLPPDSDPLPARHRGGTAIRSAHRRMADWGLQFFCVSP